MIKTKSNKFDLPLFIAFVGIVLLIVGSVVAVIFAVPDGVRLC